MADQQLQPRRSLTLAQLRALTKACDSNNTTQVAHLIETLDPPASRLSAGLASAIRGNHLNMVRYLLERGAPVKGRPVIEAVQSKSIPALEMLREFGWEVNMQLEDEVAFTALHYATDDPNILAYLLKLGANPNLGPYINPGVGSWANRMMTDTSGSVLQLAVAARNFESVDLLVAHGANIKYGAVMHVAVDDGSLDMMAHLLELGANIDRLDTVSDMGHERYGRPLLRAIVKGKTDAVKLLLDKGASTTVRGHDGETAMDMVKKDWVLDEIKKMVEEVGERGPMQPEDIVIIKLSDWETTDGRVVEKRESAGTEKERRVEERDGKQAEKDPEREDQETGGAGRKRKVEEKDDTEAEKDNKGIEE